ncbi:polysaccharide biosynthesis/export family protein [Zoogloea sp.]|uniref:polysaccharide biosynthesis/export family protein n=1 Tax=Zoogloea sp. TaxID=49181 RepID=UPI0035B2C30A
MKNIANIYKRISPLLALTVLGCSSVAPLLPSSGPSRGAVVDQEQVEVKIPVLDLDAALVQSSVKADVKSSFADAVNVNAPPPYVVGAGDVLEIIVWEAPPAALFAVTTVDPRIGGGASASRAVSLPEQVVNQQGVINVPFAGLLNVAGKTPQQIESEVVLRLKGKANQPQALVRISKNTTSNVTVVGDVYASIRMPLSPKGERLLDAVAAAGGVKQPVGKMTLQLSREGRVLTMPLDRVIQEPRQNIYLYPGDVVTALFQPLSFTALGAAGKNEEINFEAQGITLAQALGRMSGVRDGQADARGVFIFRFENPGVLKDFGIAGEAAPDGRIPVVYRVDLKDPRTFLLAQNFPVRNRDVLYVANAPAAEIQKFLGIVTSSIYSIYSLVNLKQ